MVQDENGSLKPFPMDHIYDLVPELNKCSYKIDTCQMSNIIDSSNMTPSFWVDLAEIIEQQYDNYDGFVILHGTDTMAYTASALSFMFKNLSKPIVPSSWLLAKRCTYPKSAFSLKTTSIVATAALR